MAAAQLAALKQEPPDLSEPGPSSDYLVLEEKILALCAEHPKGITDEMLANDQPNVHTELRMKALQRLLSQGKVDLLKQGTTLMYRARSSSSQSKTKGFEKEERLVYQIIEDSSNKGIWVRDIRIKCNLLQTQLMRILRSLESRKLIKSVKSVQASKRKVYMLYELSPDESVTGGAWYSDQDFESEFVKVLNQQCHKFLKQKAFKAQSDHKDPISRKSASYSTTAEVCKFITELGISKVSLTTGNIETILNTLLYDGLAEFTLVSSGQEGEGLQRIYRAVNPLIANTGYSRVPCGVCPVTHHYSTLTHHLVLPRHHSVLCGWSHLPVQVCVHEGLVDFLILSIHILSPLPCYNHMLVLLEVCSLQNSSNTRMNSILTGHCI
ncbi:DNA-directed RNA polymerase III subunit RPC6-like isoform X2 [Halichondria panicea]|uniref:DNA-directed RNA polymerase III subunit RPC6-like isoform X2 n=1 Tax=Halichondria panicea TaxID=6063 RepID=UPI00312B79B4